MVSMTPLELLVAEQQVDELCDLQVVDCDFWFVQGRDDQVLLLRAFADLHIPCRYAVDAAAGENRI